MRWHVLFGSDFFEFVLGTHNILFSPIFSDFNCIDTFTAHCVLNSVFTCLLLDFVLVWFCFLKILVTD
jgi:hypothetical protein